MPGETTQIVNLKGLYESEVQGLRNQYGRNIFITEESGNFRRLLLKMVTEPMFLMLLLACTLYFILGEPKEGILMLVAMIFVAAISFYQEVKSSRALNALIQFTESKVTVIRDGREKVIATEELLPGDIMILEEGNRINADGVVVQQNDLTIDESIISGESLPVEKNEKENHNLLFQGTIINSGKCYAKVTAIGNNTVLGKLGKSISIMPSGKTPLQHQLNRFLKFMALFGIIAFVIIWVVNYLNNSEPIQSLLFALSLAMSIVPEEIPVAYSSFMALGAYHMAKLGIIARNPSTIENLGAVNIICIDKTGTITENKMAVRTIYDYENNLLEELSPQLQGKNVLRWARLASESVPFDAMEKGIVEACEMYIDISRETALKMIYEYPLSGQPPMMTHVYDYGGTRIIAGKGAPERILKVSKISDPEILSIRQKMEAMASRGFRVIGVCSATHNGIYPKEQGDFNWKFEGLLALYDPPKRGVRQVLEQWYRAGIQVKLLTGDFPGTAKNIAGQVGIINCEQDVTGDQVMMASDIELRQFAQRTALFARMFPEAKLKLINALKAGGNIVAMTGDGVNDGPALKSAHIGIAMGKKGTEIAKHAADLILTDDHLERITDAIEQGRRIYGNLKKAIRYIISIHIPIILTVTLPLLLGWKYANIFTPIHIVFLELIMGPTCSIFYEREPAESNIMNTGPRKATPNIFSSAELFISIIQGIVITIGLLALYYFFMMQNFTVEYTRTMVFITILLSNVFLTFANRSFEKTIAETIRYKNQLVPLVLGISVVFISALLLVSPLQNLFRLTAVRPLHFVFSLGISILSTMWFEIYKLVSGRSSITRSDQIHALS
ncbi:MAG: cation-translocating P-type ATPase [Bacteroidota bacterium]|nr:cation-translocating P-type ATPase [Bacteroidota bacterium]